jgi:RNA polymerase sigma-70 factor, ECF subfamily
VEPASPSEPERDDVATLRAVRRGDSTAGRTLVESHAGAMMRTARSILGRYGGTEAHDVVQEAFVAALVTQALPDRDVGAWLRAIAARKALDWLRENARRSEVRTPDPATTGASGDSPTDVIAVRSALARLGPLDRAVLTLVDLDGFSMAEAARAIGSTTMAVKWRAVRARRKLRAFLGDSR